MISIISATTRPNSYSLAVAEKYAFFLREREEDVQLFSLEKMPVSAYNEAVYKKGENPLRNYGNSIFLSADRFIIIIPEYNGSYPGSFKLLLDICDPDIFRGKKFALVGVSSGRAGNLRGMDHLLDVLQYLRGEVFSYKLPISQIRNLTDEEKDLIDENTIKAIKNQLDEFEKF